MQRDERRQKVETAEGRKVKSYGVKEKDGDRWSI